MKIYVFPHKKLWGNATTLYILFYEMHYVIFYVCNPYKLFTACAIKLKSYWAALINSFFYYVFPSFFVKHTIDCLQNIGFVASERQIIRATH